MAELKKLSSSKITTYKGCSMAYFLKYVAHEKVPTNVRFAFGKAIHYMIERFYDYNYKTAESFANFWKFYWFRLVSGESLRGKEKERTNIREYKTKTGVVKIGDHIDIGQNSPDADPLGIFFGYMNLGENILKKFYQRHIPEKRLENGRKPPIHNEFGFGNTKENPFFINGVPMMGFIDRIDEKNGKFFIADYKTDKGSPAIDSFVLHRHPQFTIYSHVFRELFKKKEKAILYYHLRSGKVFETYRSEKDYDYVKRLIDDVVDGIKKDKFVPFYGFHCKMCDLKTACEKYSIKHHGGPRIDLEGKIKTAKTFDEWDAPLPEKANWIADMQEEKE